MLVHTMFIGGFIACGALDKSDTAESETDTAAPEETSSPEDTGGDDSGSSDSSEPEETGDIPDNPQDTGNNDVNNSEEPPLGECTINSMVAHIESFYGQEGSEQFFQSFIWEMSEDENGILAVFAGYKTAAEVDVCSMVSSGQLPEYPQVIIRARPTLSELPQTLNVGLPDIHENVGATVFFGDPTLGDGGKNLLVTAGTLTINSIISEEKAFVSEALFAELSEEGEGGWNDLTVVDGYIRADQGSGVIACYCEGLDLFYSTLND
ncbi:MAG: hypothetical protein VX278_13120 [Myxococcota bacterium]|nr:hypothetical protein [Myxococcota bacterium]